MTNSLHFADNLSIIALIDFYNFDNLLMLANLALGPQMLDQG